MIAINPSFREILLGSGSIEEKAPVNQLGNRLPAHKLHRGWDDAGGVSTSGLPVIDPRYYAGPKVFKLKL
jgi:hypothetical protein